MHASPHQVGHGDAAEALERDVVGRRRGAALPQHLLLAPSLVAAPAGLAAVQHHHVAEAGLLLGAWVWVCVGMGGWCGTVSGVARWFARTSRACHGWRRRRAASAPQPPIHTAAAGPRLQLHGLEEAGQHGAAAGEGAAHGATLDDGARVVVLQQATVGGQAPAPHRQPLDRRGGGHAHALERVVATAAGDGRGGGASGQRHAGRRPQAHLQPREHRSEAGP